MLSCNHNCCSSIDNQQANLEIRFWPGEGEEPLSFPKAHPLQVDSDGNARDRAGLAALLPREQKTQPSEEPSPFLLCVKGEKKKAHLYKVTGLALNSARLKAPFKGTALEFQWSCFAIQVLFSIFYRWKRKNLPTPVQPRESFLAVPISTLSGRAGAGGELHWGTAVSIITILTRTIAISTEFFPASGIWADHSSTFEPNLYPKKDSSCFELVHTHVG